MMRILGNITNRVGHSLIRSRLATGAVKGIPIVRILRAISPESFLSRFIVRMIGGRLSYKLVSGFLGCSIYLLKTVGLITGFILIREVFKLMRLPQTFAKNLTDFLLSPVRNPTTNPIAQQVLLDWAKENIHEIVKIPADISESLFTKFRRWVFGILILFIIRPFLKSIIRLIIWISIASLTILWNTTLQSYQWLVTFAEFFIGSGQNFCWYMLDSRPLTPIKEQIEFLKDKSIEFINVLVQSYGKGKEPITPPGDPCVGIEGVTEPSTYYITGLIVIATLLTITTIFVVLDYNEVEWIRKTPIVSTWLDWVYFIPNKIVKFWRGEDLTKAGIGESTTPKDFHLGPGPVEDYNEILNMNKTSTNFFRRNYNRFLFWLKPSLGRELSDETTKDLSEKISKLKDKGLEVIGFDRNSLSIIVKPLEGVNINTIEGVGIYSKGLEKMGLKFEGSTINGIGNPEIWNIYTDTKGLHSRMRSDALETLSTKYVKNLLPGSEVKESMRNRIQESVITKLQPEDIPSIKIESPTITVLKKLSPLDRTLSLLKNLSPTSSGPVTPISPLSVSNPSDPFSNIWLKSKTQELLTITQEVNILTKELNKELNINQENVSLPSFPEGSISSSSSSSSRTVTPSSVKNPLPVEGSSPVEESITPTITLTSHSPGTPRLGLSGGRNWFRSKGKSLDPTIVDTD